MAFVRLFVEAVECERRRSQRRLDHQGAPSLLADVIITSIKLHTKLIFFWFHDTSACNATSPPGATMLIKPYILNPYSLLVRESSSNYDVK